MSVRTESSLNPVTPPSPLALRPLGRSDLRVTGICLGTMTFGEQNSEADGHAQLDRARAAGINFIDTAELYAVPPRPETYGATETIVGRWLKRQPRDELVVATKIAGPGRPLTWIRGGPPAFDRANLEAALDGSLRRLQTDYIDLYQLHWPARNQPMFGQWQYDANSEHAAPPIAETLSVLADFVRAGKIRAFGLSNEHPWGVMKFVAAAEQAGLPRPATIQNAYNLVNRTFDVGLAEVCAREQVSLLAYSPLAFGWLSGKYLDDARAPGRVTRFAGFGQRYEKPGLVPAVRRYVALARDHGLSPATLALAWCYRRRAVTSTIIGATTPAQLEENLAAAEVTLSDAVLAEIDALYLQHGSPAP